MLVRVQKKQGSCRIDVDFDTASRGITALSGPSGAGKTTVLHMVAGLAKPDEGRIEVAGRCLFDRRKGIDLPPEQRRIGYVFQEARLFPHMHVRANLLYGQGRWRGAHAAQGAAVACPRRETASFEHVVELLGIGALLERKPRTLSGGEKQRVAFGRAVLSSPQLLLMDEPLASLDEERKSELLPFIRLLNKEFSIPILYVSHAQEEIQELTSCVIRMEQGKVLA